MPPDFHSFRRSNPSTNETFDGHHRIEHWYRDNQVYFITARCRDRFHAFAQEQAKAIFWDRFEHYTRMHHFVPWVTSLLDNHYHTLGYLKYGADLGPMMRKLHGSVAKLVNDLLPERRTPFWGDSHHDDYFDGCLRDPLQGRRSFRYTFTQCIRHAVATDPLAYPHTRVNVEMERAIKRAVELNAFMLGVPYYRYDKRDARLI
jgi:hypothetical protein